MLAVTMGISKLADVIRSDAPDAISHKDISDYAGEVPDLCSLVLLTRFIFVSR